MESVLIVVGAAIFGLLGSFHLFYTFFTNKFEAYDPTVTEAMKSTSPKLTKETSMWKAWLGFNASHSLGAIFFAGIYIPLSLTQFQVIQDSLWFSILPIIVGFSYLLLAKKYWFKTPFVGILISTVCFVIAAVLINL